jgi:hypothetical protein
MNRILLIIAILLLTFSMFSRQQKGGKWTVYGTTGCGWTRKQLKHMKDNNVPHTFIDCDKKDCNGFNAYPTLKDPSGKITTGFSLVA